MIRVTLKDINDWTDALDSGAFAQGYDAMQNDTGYCCLGVLAQTMGLPIVKTEDPESEQDEQNKYIYDGFQENLSDFGLDTSELMEMNDQEGKSFKEISQFIKETTNVLTTTPAPTTQLANL